MTPAAISRKDLKKLLKTSVSARKKLQGLYEQLPATSCRRKASCCAMLPEATLIEALTVLNGLAGARRGLQEKIIRKIVIYFLINAAEITSCPFLEDGKCLIYKLRFFGCRAYGLWSPAYYENMAETSRRAKKILQEQWQELGVELPAQAIDFVVPYCSAVVTRGRQTSDAALDRTAAAIEVLSQNLSGNHALFGNNYFGDLSFLLTALIFGITPALQMKFTIVRDLIANGSSPPLDNITGELPNILIGLK